MFSLRTDKDGWKEKIRFSLSHVVGTSIDASRHRRDARQAGSSCVIPPPIRPRQWQRSPPSGEAHCIRRQ